MKEELRFSEQELQAKRCIALSAQLGTPWGPIFQNWLVLAGVWRGEWETARACAEDGARHEPPGVAAGQNWSTLFLCECLLGQRETALALLSARRGLLPDRGRPNSWGPWGFLLGVIEGLAVLRERQAADELFRWPPKPSRPARS